MNPLTAQEIESRFDQFFAANNNQSVEVEDISALDQCMDLAFKWCDVLGIPRATIRHGYAHEIWDNPNQLTSQYFNLIPNGSSNTPPKGAIVVFKVINGIPVGHVSIETGKSDSMNAITFDQNWDTLHYYHVDAQGNRIPYSRVVVHNNYYGVAGWLYPKTVEKPSNSSSASASLSVSPSASASPSEEFVEPTVIVSPPVDLLPDYQATVVIRPSLLDLLIQWFKKFFHII